MREKTVALPFEDPVTFGANAARPLLDRLSAEEKDSIELLITCTESGIDFSKSTSTYLHDQLGLSRNCRMFELKQACYAGTAGFQMACNFILSQTSPGAKALVIATDISRYLLEDGDEAAAQEWAYAEPSGGAGRGRDADQRHPARLPARRGRQRLLRLRGHGHLPSGPRQRVR